MCVCVRACEWECIICVCMYVCCGSVYVGLFWSDVKRILQWRCLWESVLRWNMCKFAKNVNHTCSVTAC